MTDRPAPAALFVPAATLVAAPAGGIACSLKAGAPQSGGNQPVPEAPSSARLREIVSHDRLGPDLSLAEIVLADGMQATALIEPERGDDWPSLHFVPHRAPDGHDPCDLGEALRAGAALRDAVGDELRTALAARAPRDLRTEGPFRAGEAWSRLFAVLPLALTARLT